MSTTQEERPGKTPGDVNEWFVSLPPERQAILKEDRWMLAGASFDAGRASALASSEAAVVANATAAPDQPWGFSYRSSNGDGTNGVSQVKGPIPSWEKDVADVVPLYDGEPGDVAKQLAAALEENRLLRVLRAGYEERLTAFQKALDENDEDAERWRAFFSSSRFTIMGTSGFDNLDYPQASVSADHDPRRNWLHFGLSVWDRHPSGGDEQGTHGRNLLVAYVDHRRSLGAGERVKDAT